MSGEQTLEEQVAAALKGSENISEGNPFGKPVGTASSIGAYSEEAQNDEEVDDFGLPPKKADVAGESGNVDVADDDEEEDEDPSPLSPSVVNPATMPHFNRPATQVADDNSTERKKTLFGKMRGVGGLAKNVSKVAKMSKGVGEGLGKMSRKGMNQMGNTLDKGKTLANKSITVAGKGVKGMSQKTMESINIGFDDMVVVGKGAKEMAGKGVHAVTQLQYAGQGQLSVGAARKLRHAYIMFLLEGFKLQVACYTESIRSTRTLFNAHWIHAY
jgi:hypothetical protein